MANTTTAYGLQAIKQSDGGYLQVESFYITDALASFGIGTPVNIGGSSNTVPVINGQEWPIGTLPTIVKATGGDGNKLLGAIVGFLMDPTDLQEAGINPASNARIAMVATHPMQRYTIVDDGAASLAVTDVGLNANLTVGTVNAFTGLDSTTLDTSTPATDATFQLKILRLFNSPTNELAAGAEWEVQINNHIYANITAGV